MYLTYDEYRQYGGVLSESVFQNIEVDAELVIDWYTFNRLHAVTEYPDAVKRCMMRVISLLAIKNNLLESSNTATASENSAESLVRMQSNDGVSTTYAVFTAFDLYNTAQTELDDIITTYLAGVKLPSGKRLTYRGVYADE